MKRCCVQHTCGLFAWLLTSWALVTASCQSVHGQQTPAPPAAGQSPAGLDAQLLEGLTPPPPTTTPAPASPSALAEPVEGEDIGQTPQHPLRRAAARMIDAQQRLARGDTSRDTQRLQREALDELRQMIDRLQQQSQQSQQAMQAAGSDATPSPSTSEAPPAPADGAPRDEPSSGDVAEEPDSGQETTARNWGHLPDRVRQQLESAAIERFLPQYEDLIEAFYLRLAEDAEQPSHN